MQAGTEHKVGAGGKKRLAGFRDGKAAGTMRIFGILKTKPAFLRGKGERK